MRTGILAIFILLSAAAPAQFEAGTRIFGLNFSARYYQRDQVDDRSLAVTTSSRERQHQYQAGFLKGKFRNSRDFTTMGLNYLFSYDVGSRDRIDSGLIHATSNANIHNRMNLIYQRGRFFSLGTWGFFGVAEIGPGYGYTEFRRQLVSSTDPPGTDPPAGNYHIVYLTGAAAIGPYWQASPRTIFLAQVNMIRLSASYATAYGPNPSQLNIVTTGALSPSFGLGDIYVGVRFLLNRDQAVINQSMR